jgi:hypothetical protein
MALESYESLTKHIDTLEASLVEAKRRRDEVKKLSMDKQLALYLKDHQLITLSDPWDYEVKKGEHNWEGPAHVQAMGYANRMLDVVTLMYYRNQQEYSIDSGRIYNECINILKALR